MPEDKKEKEKLGLVEYACLVGGIACAAILVAPGTPYIQNLMKLKPKTSVIKQESQLEIITIRHKGKEYTFTKDSKQYNQILDVLMQYHGQKTPKNNKN